MSKKDPVFNDLPEAQKDVAWLGDPSEAAHTIARDKAAEQGAWESLAMDGYSPEDIYPNEPEERARMRSYLRTVKLDKAP